MPCPELCPDVVATDGSHVRLRAILEQVADVHLALEDVLRELGATDPIYDPHTQEDQPPAIALQVLCKYGTASTTVASQWENDSASVPPLVETRTSMPVESRCSAPLRDEEQEAWPRNVKLRQHCSDSSKQVATMMPRGNNSSLPDCAEEHHRGRLSSLQDPGGPLLVCWSLAGLVILFTDLTVTPYMLAWNVPFEEFETFSYVALGYWTFDIAVASSTGYYEDGLLVTNWWNIFRRYMRTSFAPDAVFVMFDFVSVSLFVMGRTFEGSMDARQLQIIKLGRFLRLLLILRVVRCMRIFERLFERLLSEKARTVLAMSSLAVIMLWFNHIIACAWFAIGNMESRYPTRWTDVFKEDEDVVQQYIVAYHWTIAQVTLGANDIICTNTIERCFNIVCLLAGLIVGSTVISAFSASMVELQMANRDRNSKMQMLRRFLGENDVRQRLSLAVQHQVTERMRERRMLTECQVAALELLSSSLRSELRFEVVKDHLLAHVLFAQLSALDTVWCYNFCQDGFEIATLSAQDDLFFPGRESTAAFVLMRGSANYTFQLQVAFENFQLAQHMDHVRQGAWLAEATLWAEWVHVGKAVAASPCQVLQVCPAGLYKSTATFPDIHLIACEYGRQFHRRIIAAGSDGTAFPTDIEVACTDWEDMVLSMEPDVQRIISMAAADRINSTQRHSNAMALRPSNMSNMGLRDEIMAGKSIVVMNKQGQPERIVSVVVMHITRGDGRFLAQVGKFENSRATPGCELPGLKRESSELLGDALMRLRRTKMKPLQDLVQVKSSERVTIVKRSKEHKVPSKYLRHVFYCRLLGEFDAPACSAAQPFVTDKPSRDSFQQATSSLFSDMTRCESKMPQSTVLRELGDLGNREVFFFRYGPKGAFYAWLSQHEFDHLSSPAGEQAMSLWIGSLGRPP